MERQEGKSIVDKIKAFVKHGGTSRLRSKPGIISRGEWLRLTSGRNDPDYDLDAPSRYNLSATETERNFRGVVLNAESREIGELLRHLRSNKEKN